MRFEIEMFVFNPIGMIDVQRETIEFPLEHRGDIHALPHMFDNILESHLPARRRRRIINIDGHHMREIGGGLNVEKLGILCAQLAYIGLLGHPSCPF